uniref:Uncharacterized protein n=1 Tax=Anguilla anguilla TaxID=7936 RepID=A0A0E9UHK8_ANGAN
MAKLNEHVDSPRPGFGLVWSLLPSLWWETKPVYGSLF